MPVVLAQTEGQTLGPGYLGARDLGGRGVLHHAVDGDAAAAAQPGLQICEPHADVGAQPLLRARALHSIENCAASYMQHGKTKMTGSSLVRGSVCRMS
jgi:hypothetical protein